MASVVAGGPGLVAVGNGGVAGDTAAVWTSTEGLAWQPVEHDDSAFGIGGESLQVMLSVTVGGPGLVAVGRDRDSAAVWVSD